MEIKGAIFHSSDYHPDSRICDFLFKELPTTCHSYYMVFGQSDYLNNLITIESDNETYDGNFFVQASLIDVDSSEIELRLSRYLEHKSKSNVCFFKGKFQHDNDLLTVNLLFNSRPLKDLKLQFIPRTNRDYLIVDWKVYQCNSVYYKKDGTILIDLINEYEVEKFRENHFY